MNEKVLLVIGGSSDLGMELISKKVTDYDRIVVHYRTMNDNLRALIDNYEEKIIALKADFGVSGETERLIEQIEKADVRPKHIVFFHAAPLEYTSLERTDWDVFNRAVEMSVEPVFKIVKAFISSMKKAKEGKIIITLSNCVNGVPPKYMTGYVVAKSALHGMVKALAADYADKNIQINGVSPEMIDTKFLKEVPEYIKEVNAESNPMKRNLTVKDVIPTYEWLLSEGADCVMGQNVAITGGR